LLDARSCAGSARTTSSAPLESSGREHPAAPVTCSVGPRDTTEAATLMDFAVRARQRMEVIQKVRRRGRSAEGGGA
jgi:hypothetical protein